MIKTVTDSKRGCGWRKPGGLYLRTEPGPMANCGKLPMELTVCPCCSAGVKFTRGWTWIDPEKLFAGVQCVTRAIGLLPDTPRGQKECKGCSLANPVGRAGLLWIGNQFYSPEEWMQEARELGVSRRIHSLPKGFESGKTWVYVAHIKAAGTPEDPKPGVFHVFKPTAVEYVVKGDETEDELNKLMKRGITPVKVKREGELDFD